MNRHASSFYTMLYLNEYLDDPQNRKFSFMNEVKMQFASVNGTLEKLFDVRDWYKQRQETVKETRARLALDRLFTDQKSGSEKWQVEYPRPYLPWMVKVTQITNVDANLLYSVMRAGELLQYLRKVPCRGSRAPANHALHGPQDKP